MTPKIAALISKGRRSLRAARRLSAEGDHDFAVSRAYYAMFYLAEAVLLTEELEYSKHSAVLAAFQQRFVRTGKLEVEHYEALRLGFERRQFADYRVEVTTAPHEAEDVLRRARAFIDATEAYVRQAS